MKEKEPMEVTVPSSRLTAKAWRAALGGGNKPCRGGP